MPTIRQTHGTISAAVSSFTDGFPELANRITSKLERFSEQVLDAPAGLIQIMVLTKGILDGAFEDNFNSWVNETIDLWCHINLVPLDHFNALIALPEERVRMIVSVDSGGFPVVRELSALQLATLPEYFLYTMGNAFSPAADKETLVRAMLISAAAPAESGAMIGRVEEIVGYPIEQF